MSQIEIDGNLVGGFVEAFLLGDFDQPKATPKLHYEMWELFCSPSPQVALAAPRGHAKSTAGTLAYGLASLLFGRDDFALLVSATEKLAANHLANYARTLQDNQDLRTEFNVELIKCNETELTAQVGRRQFHVVGKGAEQSVRGTIWRNKRPSLILVDDLEEDEAVKSKERREKLRDWFFNALMPCGSDNMRIRVLGTILHLDSLLERLIEDVDGGWVGRRFKAHRGFDDFSEILWPEKFTEERLRRIRASYLSQSNASGYSQEYLSQPVAEADAYFRKSDLIPLTADDRRQPLTMYASIDFALGGEKRSDNTAICVAGMDPGGILHVVDFVAKHMDAREAVEEMFRIQKEYDIVRWVVEDDNISKAVGPFLNQEMFRRNEWLLMERIRPHKDKQARATSIQARMRAGGVRFDCEAPWWYDLYNELISFPRGKTDDRIDALAWIGLMLARLSPAQTEKEMEQEAWEEEELYHGGYDGRSQITGY